MSQLPITYDIEMKQGAKWTLTLELTTDGVAKSLTGYSAKMEIRPGENASEILETLSTTGGEIVITAATGTITLTLTKSETDALNFHRAIYDLFIRDSNNLDDDVCLVEGDVLLHRRVTQWS